MADQAARDKEEAMRERIVAHMNADHQDSLSLYLRHHHGVSAGRAATAQLVDATTSALVLTTDPPPPGGTYTVPLEPPLPALSAMRERLVAMDNEAQEALDVSKIPVTRYVPPTTVYYQLAIFVACTFTFGTYFKRSNFVPGSFMADKFFPALFFGRRDWAERYMRFGYRIQPLLWWPMFLLHVAEAAQMARTRMRRHQVPIGSPLWLKWVGSTFIEGFGAFLRFDAMMAKEKAGGQGKKDH